MNRYPIWKYLFIAILLVISGIYSLPNLFGETPAVQLSTNRQSIVINEDTIQKVRADLKAQNIVDDGMFIDGNSLKIRFKDADTQLKARGVIEKNFTEGYIVAPNLLADSPLWMSKIKAHPMFLGLDLRGGVHFLLEVDMKAAVDKTLERYSGEIRRTLQDSKIRYGAVRRVGNDLIVPLQDAVSQQNALKALNKAMPELSFGLAANNSVQATLNDALITKIQKDAVAQNMTTLHNRVNELGVAEPVIQQSGADRIVVQLPGVQDTAKAKDILGRTATLEVRMVEDDQTLLQQALSGNVPYGYELLEEGIGDSVRPILLKKQVELTGDNINDAQPGFDDKGQPAVHINLDNAGGRIFSQITADNVGKRMAMVLVEQGKSEVVTAPSINKELTGGRFLISGSMSLPEANDISLLLRSGSLAAPMQIIEERTIGPSLGKENISKGFHSTLWGFVAVGLFMIFYYRVFGVFSVLSLCCNLLFLISLLSLLQATLTLPGIAAIALTLGIAIDSNVLINERIREELRRGETPQKAINLGYEHAWATILDSNVTSLIAGLALLIFGSGPVRGFAVVHCLGILTSVFSSVVVSRAFVNIWYGSRRKLTSISIGQVWKPDTDVNNALSKE